MRKFFIGLILFILGLSLYAFVLSHFNPAAGCPNYACCAKAPDSSCDGGQS